MDPEHLPPFIHNYIELESISQEDAGRTIIPIPLQYLPSYLRDSLSLLIDQVPPEGIKYQELIPRESYSVKVNREPRYLYHIAQALGLLESELRKGVGECIVRAHKRVI